MRNSSVVLKGSKSSNTSRTNPLKMPSPMVNEFVNNGSSKATSPERYVNGKISKAQSGIKLTQAEKAAIVEHPAAAE